MKIYISVDLEGLPYATHWDEVTRWKTDFPPFQKILINHLNSICCSLNKNNVDEIWINDAHGVSRSFTGESFPNNVILCRGISGHPFGIMQNLDSSFDAVILVGSHSGAGMNHNTMEHTINDETISQIKLNNEICSEFHLSLLTASYVNVPIILVSGDKGICDYINSNYSQISTVETKKCLGKSTISFHPDDINKRIDKKISYILKNDLSQFKTSLPEKFNIELEYIHHFDAYNYSFYPGIKQLDENKLFFQSNDFFEVLKMFKFIVY